MVLNPKPHWTVADYLEYEAASEIKHEYIDGEIYAMTGGTLNHSRITSSTTIAIGSQLEGSGCLTLTSDMRVKIDETRYVYPDLSVVCGKPLTDNSATTLLNPVLVVEVTSPSSADYDRRAKRDFYLRLPSLRAYLIIDQQRVYAELYSRRQDRQNRWQHQTFADLNALIRLPIANCTLTLAQVYRGIIFDLTQAE